MSDAFAAKPNLSDAAPRVVAAADRVYEDLQKRAVAKGSAVGRAVFIRILKRERALELYLQKTDQSFVLFERYPICTYSGELGPKLKEGDGQAPEGFYWVSRQQLNPYSNFHLSFNLGYPNPYDRAHGRTGSALMVHGNCVSVGCYAMTDEKIEEIYTLLDQALRAGQPRVKVLALPFAMSEENLQFARGVEAFQPWLELWSDLAVIDQYFAQTGIEPKVLVSQKRYRLQR